jgi:choline-sulfatase
VKPANLLFIISDQHTRDITGCYGHPVIQTPNIDRLAHRGTRFSSAYTNCPICVPARASLATGQYVHQIGNWDNAFPYNGTVPSWGHRLNEQSFRCDSIGKLHFRGPDDDNGFTEEVDPLHVVDGVGDILGCIRQNPPFRDKRVGIDNAGPGDSTYLEYDVLNADNAVQWLANHSNDEKPWCLFLSLVCPHPPYISPAELFDLYPPEELPLPSQWQQDDWPDHSALEYFRRFFHFDKPFDESVIRRLTAAYYGVCTHLDKQIGRVLDALSVSGLEDTTRVMYTSDHGESLGARGLFGKFTMYEEAAAVPMILAGPDVPVGNVCNTPVSLVDCFPTVLDCLGGSTHPDDLTLPGDPLWGIATSPDRDRTVFSEYHAVGSQTAIYMLRNRTLKYVHYVGQRPQLFNLLDDPQECHDLADDPSQQSVLQEFQSTLGALLDPQQTDAKARADQQALIETFGGEAAVRKRGAFDNSPVPGEPPAFRSHG